MESRREIDEIPELKELAFKAIETTGLKITSIDFLQNKSGQFYLTDINCTPNFNYIKNGPKIVGNYLLEQAKKG
jgi:glutathione synthase/RimK-type ligase-like ATP-grasp enzyme